MIKKKGHTETTETTENVDIKIDNICEICEICVRLKAKVPPGTTSMPGGCELFPYCHEQPHPGHR